MSTKPTPDPTSTENIAPPSRDLMKSPDYIPVPETRVETSSVEVEQIPSGSPPISDYYDMNSEDYFEPDEEVDMDQLSQLTCSKKPAKKRKQFECTVAGCNKSYPKPAQLTYHIDTKHYNLKWFTCIYKNCNKSFYYTAHMKRHLRTHGPKQWQCDLCYNTFSREENLRVHQRKCRLLLVCSVCGETFISGADIQKHRQTHCVYLKCLYKDCEEHIAPNNIREHLYLHGSVVKCPLCAAMFLYQKSLETHVTQDHKTELQQNVDYTSDVDIESWFQTMFSDLQSLESENTSSDISDLITASGITVTDQVISSDISLENIVSSCQVKETPTVLYKCPEPDCTYSTPTPRWLTKHTLNKHKRKGAHKCVECGREFADKWGLALHKSKHSERNRTFPCPYCDKSFVTQSRLSQHCQTYHPESRTWLCEECCLSFSTSKRLMTHYKKHITGEFTKNRKEV